MKNASIIDNNNVSSKEDIAVLIPCKNCINNFHIPFALILQRVIE